MSSSRLQAEFRLEGLTVYGAYVYIPPTTVYMHVYTHTWGTDGKP